MSAQRHLRARHGFVEAHRTRQRRRRSHLDQHDVVPVDHVVRVRRGARQVRPVRDQEAKVGLEEELLAVHAPSLAPRGMGLAVASVASVAVGGSAAGPAGAFGVGPHEVLAVGGGEVEEEVGAHAAAAGASPGGGVRVYEICSVRARGPDGVWVGRAGALGPGNRAWSLALASTPAGSARIGSLGDLLPARVLAPLAPAAVLAGVPIAPMTFRATFFSTDAGPSGIRGRGRGRGRGPELHGVEVQLAHPLVGDGRPIVTSGHPPSPGLRQCPTFQKISDICELRQPSASRDSI